MSPTSFSLLFRAQALSIYLLFFLVGSVGALVMPTFSVFLAKEIGVRPLLVGIPFAGVALASIFYNQVIGFWSDRLRDRRPLIATFCLVGTLSCALFAFSRNYLLVAVTAVLFFSLSMVSFSQMLAYSLDYAEKHLPVERIPLFNAIVRTQIAFAWVAGPPTGFMVISHFGFTRCYLLAAGVFAVVAVSSLVFLSGREAGAAEGVQRRQRKTETALPPGSWRSLVFCVLAFSLLWGANNAYLISMPLHLDGNLGIKTVWVGALMGTTAALEVPFMLLAGYLAASLNLMYMVRFAGVAGFCLYLGIYFAGDLWQLFVLQLFNAIFIGVLAGLGVSLIQQLLPGRAGSASALYTNTTHLGHLLSSMVVAGIGEYFGYREVFIGNLLLVLLALGAFSLVRLPSRKSL